MINTSKKKAKALRWIPGLLVLGIAVISIAGFFGVTLAVISFRDATIERTSQINSEKMMAEEEQATINVDFTAGAAADYCDGTEATTNLCVVDIYDLTVKNSIWEISEDGFTKRLALPTNTTTQAGVGDSLEMTDTFIINTWGDSYCDGVTLIQKTPNDYMAMQFRVGTSTPSSTASLIATSTASLIANTVMATSTENQLNSNDHPGTAGYISVNHASVNYLNHFEWNLYDAISITATSTLNNILATGASSTGYLDNDGFVDIHCYLKTTETAE